MLHDEVFAALGQSGGFISGQELSRRFGVTRGGIHVAVERLRKAGYEIESLPKRGYRLLGGPDNLGLGDLSLYMPKERLELIRNSRRSKEQKLVLECRLYLLQMYLEENPE